MQKTSEKQNSTGQSNFAKKKKNYNRILFLFYFILMPLFSIFRIKFLVMLVEHKRDWKQAGRVLLILTSRPKRATQDHNTPSSHAADSRWRPQTDGCGGRRRRESCSWWWLCGPAITAAPHPNCSWCVPPTLRWFEDAQLVFDSRTSVELET